MCVSLKPETNILLITALMMHKLVWDSGNLISLDTHTQRNLGSGTKSGCDWACVIEHGIVLFWGLGCVSVRHCYWVRMREYFVRGTSIYRGWAGSICEWHRPHERVVGSSGDCDKLEGVYVLCEQPLLTPASSCSAGTWMLYCQVFSCFWRHWKASFLGRYSQVLNYHQLWPKQHVCGLCMFVLC